MFEELFEKTRNTNEKVNPEDVKKLAPHVRKALKQEFAGGTLADAVKSVTKGLLSAFPNIVKEEEWKTDVEAWEELVFDAAEREGY